MAKTRLLADATVKKQALRDEVEPTLESRSPRPPKAFITIRYQCQDARNAFEPASASCAIATTTSGVPRSASYCTKTSGVPRSREPSPVWNPELVQPLSCSFTVFS